MPDSETIKVVGAAITQGIRWRLFEFDELLSGKDSPLRLVAEDYTRARRAIAELYVALDGARYEPSPAAVAADRAAKDQGFQRFLAQSTKRRKRGK